ncbi:hypothetical protein AEST_22190 [Alishewanella aestuarii B11]|uniref:Uncharacterized protein n=1 Tax=Alishewanella aestuarii B11 TaxID=1197174 RepID=J2ID82_9ALTE|nr:hypothetical protein [Alishewanella aestuarii]EJI85117.1 hypothetical protein AEST_22190 [Alishewanella aestuarii B11]
MNTNHTKQNSDKNHYNTTKLSDSIINTDQTSATVSSKISLLITKSSSDYLDNITHYSAATNRQLQPSQYADLVYSSRMDDLVKPEIKNWFSLKPDDQQVDKFKLSKLSSFLSLFLSNPMAFGSRPLVDMLYLTIDVTRKELKQLIDIHLKQLPTPFKVLKRGRASPVRIKNYQDVYQHFALLGAGNEDKIAIFWGIHPKVLAARPKQRLLKVTINPARYSETELQTFFGWLKDSIGVNAKKKLLTANVTRLDIALDVVGLHLPELIVNQAGCTEYDYWPNETSDDEVVGTQRLGDPGSGHFRAYNKLQKLLDSGPFRIPILSFKKVPFQPLQITRLERVRKPHDTGGLKLGSIWHEAQYFLKGTKIYCPRFLLKLSEKQQKQVRKYGFMYWFTKLGGNSVISVQDLEPLELKINHNLLEAEQRKVLKQLKKAIISA